MGTNSDNNEANSSCNRSALSDFINALKNGKLQHCVHDEWNDCDLEEITIGYLLRARDFRILSTPITKTNKLQELRQILKERLNGIEADIERDKLKLTLFLSDEERICYEQAARTYQQIIEDIDNVDISLQ